MVRRFWFGFAAAALSACVASGEGLPLTNVVVQAYGEELEAVVPEAGLLLWDAARECLRIGDGETRGGRRVCEGTPDWHSFHKTIKLNGHKTEINSTFAREAAGTTLAVSADGERVAWVLAADEGEFARVEREEVGGGVFRLVAATTNELAVVEVTTNLLSATGWHAAANAAFEAQGAAGRSWLVTRLGGVEFYRVRTGTGDRAGVYFALPVVALGGVMVGGVLCTNWADIGGGGGGVSNAVTSLNGWTGDFWLTAGEGVSISASSVAGRTNLTISATGGGGGGSATVETNAIVELAVAAALAAAGTNDWQSWTIGGVTRNGWPSGGTFEPAWRVVSETNATALATDYLVWLDGSATGANLGSDDEMVLDLPNMESESQTIVVRRLGNTGEVKVRRVFGGITNTYLLGSDGSALAADWLGARTNWYWRQAY